VATSEELSGDGTTAAGAQLRRIRADGPRTAAALRQWVAARAPARPAIPVALVPMPPRERLRPTWPDARPARIHASLEHARDLPTGNWYVAAASSSIRRRRPFGTSVGNHDLVLWRTSDGALHAGSDVCPHLGASLATGEVCNDRLVCRWHGLSLDGSTRFGTWSPYPTLDDGVLAWVRLDDLDGLGGEDPLAEPVITARPPADAAVPAVIETVGRCEPDDVIANRLDPWHGAWFHPYSFSHLAVDEDASTQECLVVDVTFRLSRRWGVPVRAEFACPDRRTIVMTITEGEGAGSVVETHATPRREASDGTARTSVIEATIAYSDRSGFASARAVAPAARPLMRWAAARLWVDDLAYAERTYELRRRDRA